LHDFPARNLLSADLQASSPQTLKAILHIPSAGYRIGPFRAGVRAVAAPDEVQRHAGDVLMTLTVHEEVAG
jgi:hypothetical protein